LAGHTTNSPPTEPTFYFNATAYNETVFTQFSANAVNLPALQAAAEKKSPLFKTILNLQTRRHRGSYPFDS
jgi:hypothetical protein